MAETALPPCQPCPACLQILLCLTLLLVANLLTRTLSSLVAIKLKQLNHRQRMMELSKRVSGWLVLVLGGLWARGACVQLSCRRRRLPLWLPARAACVCKVCLLHLPPVAAAAGGAAAAAAVLGEGGLG